MGEQKWVTLRIFGDFLVYPGPLNYRIPSKQKLFDLDSTLLQYASYYMRITRCHRILMVSSNDIVPKQSDHIPTTHPVIEIQILLSGVKEGLGEHKYCEMFSRHQSFNNYLHSLLYSTTFKINTWVNAAALRRQVTSPRKRRTRGTTHPRRMFP